MKSRQKLTAHLHAAVVAVAGLGVEVEDDAVGVGVGSADLAVGVLPLAAFPSSSTTSLQSNCGSESNNQHQSGVITANLYIIYN